MNSYKNSYIYEFIYKFRIYTYKFIYMNSYTHAHVPGLHMRASAGPGPISSSPKQWKLDGSVKIYNSLGARSPLTKSTNEKIIKSAAI